MGLSGPFAEAAESVILTDEPSDVSATPAPTAEPVAPVSVAESAEVKAERLRDESGKFAKAADKTVDKGVDTAETKPEQTEAPAKTEPEVKAEAAVTPEPEVVPEPYIPAGHEKPFFEGALKHPTTGDVFIPAAQVDKLERLAMRGERYEQYRDDRREAIANLERHQTRTAAIMGVLNDHAVKYLESPEALESLAQAIQTHGAASVFRQLDLDAKEAMLRVNTSHPEAATPAARESEDHAPALDKDDARDTFEDYWRDQMQKPEFKGMPQDLQSKLRASLIASPLFQRHPQHGWGIQESVGAPFWAMAKEAMTRSAALTKAHAFNDKQRGTTGKATPAPPAVSTAKPVVGTGAKPTAAADPLLNPRTGKRYDNPWDAIKNA